MFDVLADVDRYPLWWKQVRQVERIDADTGVAHVRSVLPYALTLRMTRAVEDPAAGVLRVDIAGDLTGYAQFTRDDAVADDGASAFDYLQEVVVTDRWLRHVACPLAWPLRANHAAMMRSGERGLRAYLSR